MDVNKQKKIIGVQPLERCVYNMRDYCSCDGDKVLSFAGFK